MNIIKLSALFETSLASAMSAAATTFTVVSGTDRDGNALSGLYGFILDEGTADEEFVIGTISSTTVTVSYRGIDADAPNTEVSANKKAHRRGASVKITDYPLLGILRNILNGDETLPNKLQYASHPSISGNQDIPDKQYVDSLANTGAADATTTVQGLVEEATQAEVEAGTATGGTGAKLFMPNDKHGAKLYFGYAADAGSNDSYAITLAPVPSAYTVGMVIVFKANTINTGAATINVNSLGAKDIRRNNGLVLANGDIQASQFNTIVYNGTYFELQSPIGKAQVSQSGEEIYAASATGNDTYVITVAPVPAAYVTGQRFYFKPDTANTGAATLNVNSLGAKSILRPDGSALANGDIAANQIVGVSYDGTNFLMNTPVANAPKFAHGVDTRTGDAASGTQNIAHGLGRAPRFVNITALKSLGANSQQAHSAGSYDGSSTASIWVSGATATASGTDTTNTVYIEDSSGNSQAAVVTVDATNIILTWTKTGTPSNATIKLLWKAQA